MDRAGDIQSGISEAFASVLRSGRDGFNAQFNEARRLYRDLDSQSFLEFLRTDVDPLVRAIQTTQPDSIADVAMVAYEIGLELVGQKLAGAGARTNIVQEGWRRILPEIPSLVAATPGRMISAISNALHQIGTTPGARAEEWIGTLETLGPKCETGEILLKLGQVAAWKAGLAHFREGAIAAADALPTSLALRAVGADASSDWSTVRKGLLADPWFNPGTSKKIAKGGKTGLQVMAQAGAFRGFGGVFIEPPSVALAGEHFLVRSGEESWLLTADVFGATFHRTSLADFEEALRQKRFSPELQFSGSRLLWHGQTLELAEFGKISSAAATDRTAVVTTELSHAVTLVAAT